MAVFLAPVYNDAQFISNVAANGAKLFTYVAGSTTKVTTYTTSAGSVAHSNPIILNSRGEPPSPIWITGGTAVDFVFAPSTDSDPPVAVIRTIADVRGVGDTTTSVDQWVASALTPTYISATSFTLVGDQTTAFHVGRRLKSTTSGGTIYSTIVSSAFTTSTLVTVANDSGVLDAGLSAVSYGLLTNINPSLPAIIDTRIQNQSATAFTTTGTSPTYVATPTPALTTYTNAYLNLVVHAAIAGTPTMNWSGLGVKNWKYVDKAGVKQFVTPAQAPINHLSQNWYDGVDVVLQNPIQAWTGVRQTVYSAPVDANGFANFGGSTGSSSVTVSGTLYATSANGFGAGGELNTFMTITNPVFTGLTTNGTMFLYLDSTNGAVTTGSTTLEPNYQFGGTYSITSNQFTYNIQEAVGKVGNGASATQVNRVFVGEVTVAGGVVTAIIWYALNGRYDSGYTATLIAASATYTKNHNIGTKHVVINEIIENTTTDLNYSVGDIVINPTSSNATYLHPPGIANTRNSYVNRRGVTGGYAITNISTGVNAVLTAANWKYKAAGGRSIGGIAW